MLVLHSRLFLLAITSPLHDALQDILATIFWMCQPLISICVLFDLICPEPSLTVEFEP